MHQAKCVEFLNWAMPRLGLHRAGFTRVHRQVCKRLGHRITELGFADFDAYRSYVAGHDSEWATVDSCCRITVSRFFRDVGVFSHLANHLLPQFAKEAKARGIDSLRAWSAGCGAGEEPYSLALAWRFVVAPDFPDLALSIIASDIDDSQLARARTGCYRPSSLRELPAAWREIAFVAAGSLLCLRPDFRSGIEFVRQDIRAEAPQGPFDLVLCRNLAFTYFDASQQRQVLAVLLRELAPGGALVLGRRELLPTEPAELSPWMPSLRIYRKRLMANRSNRAGLPPQDTTTKRLQQQLTRVDAHVV